MNTHWRLTLLLVASLATSGCQTIGAGSVQRDRISYADALGSSWKEQTLLNIVKLRYLDTPVYLDVSSVISSYELASQVNLAANVFPGASAGNNQTLGATGTYTDKPTISYTPITGERYMNSLIRPIPPQAIFAMIEAGHPADLVLRVTARAINGVYNYSASQPRARAGDPTFQKVLEAMRRIQDAGALSVRVEKRDDQETTYIGFSHGAGEDVEKNIRLVKDALRLNPGNDEPVLVFGSHQRNPDQIALLTRSVQEILTELSVGVEVPERDLAEGRATPKLRPDQTAGVRDYPLMRIQSGSERPSDAFAAVPYRNRWFWISDRDLNSKRMFMFLSVFSALAETGTAPQIPLITIPAR
ncbi:MAG: hypothetical protein M0P42_15980 [Gallionella sp.]|jgi:hypothetical protein|nr:hypothetical protein [Gallionella sp.]